MSLNREYTIMTRLFPLKLPLGIFDGKYYSLHKYIYWGNILYVNARIKACDTFKTTFLERSLKAINIRKAYLWVILSLKCQKEKNTINLHPRSKLLA